MLSVFDEPFIVDGRPLSLSASLGLALSNEEPDATAEDLVRFADTALYEAKNLGRNRLHVFDDSLRDRSRNELIAADELRSAISCGDIEVWLQPIHELGAGRIIAAECLARWIQDDGVRTAGAFMETAARAGLMRDLDALVIEQTAELLESTLDALPCDFRFALNVPPSYAPWFIARSVERFGEQGLRHVTFELTETDIALDMQQVHAAIEQARSLGASVMLDDFGTGHSSLSLLMSLPLDGLKIDQQFVRADHADRAARVVMAAAIDVGRSLDLHLIAEGVETEEQVRRMHDAGVHCGQGWFYSAAGPADELVQRLTNAE